VQVLVLVLVLLLVLLLVILLLLLLVLVVRLCDYAIMRLCVGRARQSDLRMVRAVSSLRNQFVPIFPFDYWQVADRHAYVGAGG
jgi:hypothetical protein